MSQLIKANEKERFFRSFHMPSHGQPESLCVRMLSGKIANVSVLEITPLAQISGYVLWNCLKWIGIIPFSPENTIKV